MITNNNTSQTPEVFSQQQQQFVPVRFVRYFSPVQNHNQQNIRYNPIARNQYHNQFTPQQQQNQMDPVLITTLTSITPLPIVTIPHINPMVSAGTSPTSNVFSVTANGFMPQPTVNAPTK